MAAPPALGVLGGFELVVDGRSVPLGRHTRRLLGYLAVTGTRTRRDTLVGHLWGWSPQRRASANLRTALWRVRQVDERIVTASGPDIGLHPGLEVDLARSARRARALLAGGPGPEQGRLDADILPDWDEDWLLLERERHRQLRVHALEALSARLTAGGRFAAAIDAAYEAIAAEPLRESAHAVLIRAHLAEGNRAEAIRQFGVYRRLIHRELGLAPSPELAALLPVAA